ncbi:MAG: YkvA family protein [Bariatricus sp.]
MNLRDKAKKLKADIPVIYLVLRDQDTPVLAKIFAGITVGYALSPIDLIPDFIPVLGYLDDVILLPLFIILTMKMIPEEIWEKNRSLSENLWKDGKPKKWYYAVPIIVLWILVLCVIVKIFR